MGLKLDYATGHIQCYDSSLPMHQQNLAPDIVQICPMLALLLHSEIVPYFI